MAKPSEPLKVLFCWSDISGYIGACWSALARRPEVRLRVLALRPSDSFSAPFDDSVTAGLDCRLLDTRERRDAALVKRLVLEDRPDVVVMSGWMHRSYVRLLRDPELRGVRFVCAVDTQIEHDWRQQLAPLKIGGFLKRIDAIAVPGERGYQLMKFWGLPDDKILRGTLGYDDRPLENLLSEREALTGGWPRKFVYVGRYVPIKGLDILASAYARYRERVRDPWPLLCCGGGELESVIRGLPGIEDRGFVQPRDLPPLLRECGVFVLCSRRDRWGVAIAEAGAAGLPVICSEGCGAVPELVRSFYNGMVVPTGDVEALAVALGWMHDHPDRLRDMGRAGRHIALAFSSERWADRWVALFQRLCGNRG